MNPDRIRFIRYFDWSILFILGGLALFSYFGISGANPTHGEAMKQLLWYGISFGVLILFQWIDYRWLTYLSYPLWGVGVLSLLALLLFGPITNNTTGWFEFGGIKIQPAEFMKLFTILAVSYWFSRMKEKEVEIRAFYQLWPVFLFFGLPFLLIVKQPDLGNAVILIGILFAMLIVAGVRWRHILYVAMIGLSGIAVLAYIYLFHNDFFFDKIIKKYQWNRITVFLNPDAASTADAGYQVSKSLIAIGSGLLQGKGFTQKTLTETNWVPEAQTDFVFSVIGEKFGFIGSSILILLFFLLIYRLIRIAMETEYDYGKYVIGGFVGMFVFQIFENIGMTIGIMPVTGITLPFISYGGSSLLTNMIAIAIVLNIGLRRKKLMF
ncbi:rod shape-determining protein RodA [Thermicanus aegyptius]|uniref:rod shape-determining protein RodA n=1 Tax=Thermicanus aegyptius TaxID=94009 RepID=UPI000410843E|nr:rod shape-determining protein RodA [Thermicanus aegyptius]MBE3555316.1 rod shape-determining protein RodA [Thermicanus sp.]